MAPQRLSKGRFGSVDDASPKPTNTVSQNHKDLGLSKVDPGFAIGQSGGVVVVMQEFHDESAFDTGDFSVALSRVDKRKQAQQEREAELRRKKEEERKAAIASKKEKEAQAAREAAAAKEAERKKKAEEERKQRKEAERAVAEKAKADAKAESKPEKKQRSNTPAPPPVPAPKVTPTEAAPEKPWKAGKSRRAADKSEERSAGAHAVLRDSAVVGIGKVIQRAQARSPVRLPSRVFVDASAQTDLVRILPVVEERPPATQSASSSAAWWLQQQAAPAQQPAAASSDQFMMQAYIDAMQRMGQQPPQSSSYGYWTGQHQAPPPQAPAADLYWQQNVYQAGPGRFPPRR